MSQTDGLSQKLLSGHVVGARCRGTLRVMVLESLRQCLVQVKDGEHFISRSVPPSSPNWSRLYSAIHSIR